MKLSINWKFKMMNILFSIILGLLFFSHVAYAKTCDYEKLKLSIKQQGFSRVSASPNELYKSSKETQDKWIKIFNFTKEQMYLKSLNKVEYSFETNMVDLASLQQFVLLQYDTETDAKFMEDNLKKEIELVNKGNDHELVKIIKKSGLNTSQLNFKRVNNYIAIFLFGKTVKDKALPILEEMECDNFDFENFFGKKVVPLSFDINKPQKKATYRKIATEKAAIEDAMYTSEVGSLNSLNNKIILLQKDYHFSRDYILTDKVNLRMVTLKMKNTTNKDIFSIDVFVAYYDNQDTIIDVTRKTVYTIKANSEFEVESNPSSFSRKAKTAFTVFVLVNPKPKE